MMNFIKSFADKFAGPVGTSSGVSPPTLPGKKQDEAPRAAAPTIGEHMTLLVGHPFPEALTDAYADWRAKDAAVYSTLESRRKEAYALFTGACDRILGDLGIQPKGLVEKGRDEFMRQMFEQLVGAHTHPELHTRATLTPQEEARDLALLNFEKIGGQLQDRALSQKLNYFWLAVVHQGDPTKRMSAFDEAGRIARPPADRLEIPLVLCSVAAAEIKRRGQLTTEDHGIISQLLSTVGLNARSRIKIYEGLISAIKAIPTP